MWTGGLRKTTKILGQESRFTGRDLNPGAPEYDWVTVFGINVERRTFILVFELKVIRIIFRPKKDEVS
jgi:hypothetical protein